MAEKVIVAVDGGTAGDAGVEWVIERSKGLLLDVEVTGVLDSGIAPPGSPLADRSPLHDAVGRAAARITAGSSGVKVTEIIRRGVPAKSLIAASQHANLLVIGTNKTSKLARVIHGTLPLRVAGRARCTTVVVPVDWQPRGSGVVIGWDDDGTADVALEFAAEEAERLGTELTVVHAWSMPPAMGADEASAAFVYEEVLQARQEALTSVVQRVRAGHPGLEVIEQFEPRSASLALVRVATGAQLLVVGSHGRGALGGLILGSVSHDALMNMPAPIAVVPHPDEPITVLPEILDEELL